MNIFAGKIGTGTIIAAVGMAIYQTVDLCPVETWIPWIKWMGSIVAILGGSTVAYGLTGKVDSVVNNQKSIMPIMREIQNMPLTEKRFVQIMTAILKRYPPPPKT